MLDVAQVRLAFFEEGAFSFIEVTGDDGQTIVDRVFDPNAPVVFQIPVAAGPLTIRAYQRGCVGECPTQDNLDALDPIGLECETTLIVSSADLARVRIAVDGLSCEIEQVPIVATTPRRCLPDDVALVTSMDRQSDGALAITTGVENVGPSLCEVVIDQMRAALIAGTGDLLDVEGNPIWVSAASGSLFPGESLQITFDWRNSCGDYAAPSLQVFVMNLGRSDTVVDYPTCDPSTTGTFELFDIDSTVVDPPTASCQGVVIHRIDWPHQSALGALIAELDYANSDSSFASIVDLAEFTADDFLATRQTDAEAAFRLLTDNDTHLTIRARTDGKGWGVDCVTYCGG